MGPIGRFALIAAVAGGLAACVQTVRWTHPTISQDLWSTDLGSCRASASRLINQELRNQPGFDSPHERSIDRRLAAFDARKRETQLLERCMRTKGYIKGKPKAAGEAA